MESNADGELEEGEKFLLDPKRRRKSFENGLRFVLKKIGYNLSDESIRLICEEFLKTKDISKVKSIQNVGNLIVIHFENGTQEAFNYNSKDNLLEDKERSKVFISSSVSTLEFAINALHNIFDSKKNQWFGNLDEKDKALGLTLPQEIVGKTPQELQKIIEKHFDTLSKIGDLDTNSLKSIEKSRERYFQMLMGIGDIYERGATFFKKSKEQFNDMIKSLIRNKSPEECLGFFYSIEKEMFSNTCRSAQVNQSYELVSKILPQKIFEKFKKNKVEAKYFLELAKIITGRGGKYVDNSSSKEEYLIEKLKNPSLGNDIIIYLFSEHGEIMQKLEQSKTFDFKDPYIGKKDPRMILNEARKNIGKYIMENGKYVRNSDKYIENMGFKEILTIDGESYEELSLKQKVMISTLARFSDKIFSHTHDGIGEGAQEKPQIPPINAQDILAEVFEDANASISKEISKKTTWSLSNIWGKTSKELGLSGVDAEVFSLFQEIHGNGLFSISDYWKDWGTSARDFGLHFGAVLTIGLATGIIVTACLPLAVATSTVGIIGVGMTIGFVATGASIGLEIKNGKGFETPTEAGVDIGSSLAVGTVMGGIGQPVASGLLNFTRFGTGHNFHTSFSTIGDLSVFQVPPEMYRSDKVREHFQSESVLSDEQRNKH